MDRRGAHVRVGSLGVRGSLRGEAPRLKSWCRQLACHDPSFSTQPWPLLTWPQLQPELARRECTEVAQPSSQPSGGADSEFKGACQGSGVFHSAIPCHMLARRCLSLAGRDLIAGVRVRGSYSL
ncbi:hypothetical protein HaLaN_27879 [Haematococcus lacustris]|uniref:Uncharacterized protein n=1 Tax=Haematococcus lacustris TaxID=44745 RepID=A0A6A0A9E7_HAELA|nr:hypothetical protein HaLaN_27879 [Haematococcus lacustris]